MCTIADLISYRLKREQFVKRIEASRCRRAGAFQAHAYQSVVDPQPHLALCKGGVGDLDETASAIVHEEPVARARPQRMPHRRRLRLRQVRLRRPARTAMQMIEAAGKGVLCT
jgi:3,4-dihydroxy 2-butanone 4-phosphate synthase/GTP cyclohydrolase II